MYVSLDTIYKPIYKPISHLVWLVLLRQLPSHFLKSRLVFTLTTPNEVLTKRIDIHFTRSLGTFPLSRVSSHSLSSPKASIYKKKPTRVWELRFFPSIGSSFYSHKLFDSSIAYSKRSCPQKSLSFTIKVGAPKIFNLNASFVKSFSLSLIFCSLIPFSKIA